MNTLHFKYAIEVDKTKSITQAADRLFMAQPNLSKAIKELEDNLGFIVFERTPKGVVTTHKGREFLKYAKKVLEQVDKMEALSGADDMGAQSFCVTVPPGCYIAKAFAQFSAMQDFREPLSLHIQAADAMQCISDVADGRSRLGVIRYQTVYDAYFVDYLSSRQLRAEPVWEYAYVAYLSSRHALATEGAVAVDQLADYTEVVQEYTSAPCPPADRCNHAAEVSSKRIICARELGSCLELIATLPNTYMWAPPAPEDSLSRYSIIQRRCESGKRYKDVLIYSTGYRFSTADRLFVDKLYEIKNEVALREYD